MEKNIFENPNFYLNKLKNTKLIKDENQQKHTGKSVAVIFLTRYCSLECAFCIYKSKPKNKKEINKRDEFSDYGCDRVISFVNDSNVGYLMIAGGGEPFEKEEMVYKIVERAEVEKVIIVTNGFWTLDYKRTQEVFKKLNSIIKNHNYIKDFVIRFSVDKWHQKRVPLNCISEMFKIYNSFVSEKDKFKLELHTIIGDDTIKELIEEMGKEVEISDKVKYISDNKKLHKKSKKRSYIELENNQRVNVGYAKLFYPNLKINLHQPKEKIEKVLKPFYEDVEHSQDGNSSTVQNTDGTFGLDYLINFNGNVSTWGNYQLNNIPNLYLNSNKEINDMLYNDIISYSYINLDLREREKIIDKVNPLAVLRAASINVRDYSGAYLLYETKTALYYAIMIIKRYIKEKVIENDMLHTLPKELYEILGKEEEDIIALYKASNYSIVNQYIEDKEENIENWAALMYLIKNGHFKVSEEQSEIALEYINNIGNQYYSSIEEIIKQYDEKIYPAIIEKMTQMPTNKQPINI